jgi:hypothetical protein
MGCLLIHYPTQKSVILLGGAAFSLFVLACMLLTINCLEVNFSDNGLMENERQNVELKSFMQLG